MAVLSSVILEHLKSKLGFDGIADIIDDMRHRVQIDTVCQLSKRNGQLETRRERLSVLCVLLLQSVAQYPSNDLAVDVSGKSYVVCHQLIQYSDIMAIAFSSFVRQYFFLHTQTSVSSFDSSFSLICFLRKPCCCLLFNGCFLIKACHTEETKLCIIEIKAVVVTNLSVLWCCTKIF